MPTFPTPTAITVHSGLSVISDVRLVASERTDTVVTIRPRDAANPATRKRPRQSPLTSRTGS